MEPNLVQFKKGVLELCVLAVLARADSYGYDIASQLSEAIGMGEGTIYPLMRRMQKDELVSTYFAESPSGPPRKYYTLTEAGRTSFRMQRNAWEEFAAAVTAVLAPSPVPRATDYPPTPITVHKPTGNKPS
ncbi:putative transcriptional regulator [Kozakia baliensis NRIC 0488]|uniref:PadR family transcriptional regulator n=1 Tax=Kozakia baliensis TaxID=153496 RepID=UPI0009F5D264|nr:PadR family transcriptional regulator [Kozakia baliensis]GBR32755.1 putative transcriptional regulator [Kozakia baliensis NRIC 0488]GEL65527.1 PadR family transcriptional regulator [Kozakia baliensis]